ncbi:hypothetical protein JCM21900_006041 [Sporobolomyces salmonicolor]
MAPPTSTLLSLHALTLSPTPLSTPSAPAPPSSSVRPSPSPSSASAAPPRSIEQGGEAEAITYRAYRGEQDLPFIVELVDDELSEPYNLYTYRYFLDEWPHLCFFAFAGPLPIGCIVCKSEPHTKSSRSVPLRSEDEARAWVEAGGPILESEGNDERRRRPLMRGYLAMLSTRKGWRGRGVATQLLRLSLSLMLSPPPALLPSLPTPHPSRWARGVDEIVLETESDNLAALAFYTKMGFVREKRLYRFYLNGKSAERLRLAVVRPEDGDEREREGR